MSDSGYNLTSSSRRKPVNGRRQARAVKKVKVAKPQAGRNSVNPTIDTTGVRVKRIPVSETPRVGIPLVRSSRPIPSSANERHYQYSTRQHVLGVQRQVLPKYKRRPAKPQLAQIQA